MDWRVFAKRLLLGDGIVGPAQAAVARAALAAQLRDGQKVSADEFKLILDVWREATLVGHDFGRLVYDLLAAAILRDGAVVPDEVTWVRDVFLAGRPPAEADLVCLREIEANAASVCPEFEAMMVAFEGPNRTRPHRKVGP